MLICSREERQRLGLDAIFERCFCRSPQGRILKNRFRFYREEEREALLHEFTVLAELRASLLPLAAQWHEIEGLLSRFRALEGSLNGLESRRLLDETELFEIKRCLGLIRLLCDFAPALKAASCVLTPMPEAEALLNPPGLSVQGFHIYSAYSEKLGGLREAKRELEKRIMTASGEERDALLFERSGLVDEERREVQKQTALLCHSLQPMVPLLRRNLEAVAELDFRLARARLAELWQAPVPELAAPDEDCVIEEAVHPLVEEELQTRGRRFVPQSIRIRPGSTVISGANMGGKSVALESFLLCLLLTHLGYCPPCRALRTPLFDFFAYLAEQSGEVSLGLSSFGMEAARIREQLRLARKFRGFVVMDEPCRGTNPDEATAIIRALCRIYARSRTRLLTATHYGVPHEQGIRHYRIRGITEEADEMLSEGPAVESTEALDAVSLEDYPNALLPLQEGRGAEEHRRQSRVGLEDAEAVRRIRERMDYRLREIEGAEEVPEAAIHIAEWMGIDADAIAEMRRAYKEEETWPN